MIYLDASALLALLLDEPAAPDVETILREDDVCITAVTYAEVVDQAVRVQKKAMAEVARAIDPLITSEALRIAAVSLTVGVRAGELRAQHYDRRSCPVSLGDCILLGAAAIGSADVATSDQAVTDVAREIGVSVRALPNSQGVRPTAS